jgi:drug/metabolite transporter (DMT)-like permease
MSVRGTALRLPTSTAVVAGTLCVVWGMTFVVQRIGLRASGALWFAADRSVVAAVVLAPALVWARGLGWRGHALALALGGANVSAFLGLQVAGLQKVGAGPAATLVYTQPILVVVMAHLLLGERATRRRLVGAAVGFAGVAVVGLRELSVGSPSGVALLLGAAGAYAAGTLLLKVAARQPFLALVALQNLYGAVPLVALALAFERPPAATASVVLAVLYAGAFASAGGWLLLTLLLRRGEAGIVASYIFLVPVLGALFGALVLGEPLGPSIWIGATLVAAGIRIVATERAVAP